VLCLAMLRILFSVLLASAIYTPAFAQQALDFREVAEFTFTVWDESVENLRKTRDAAQAATTDAGPKDSRGRTMNEDIKELVLTGAVEKRLEALREQARAQGSQYDTAALNRILAEARPLVEAEVFKLMLTTSYWLALSTLDHHHRLLEPWLASAPRKEREDLERQREQMREKFLSLRTRALDQTTTPTRMAVFDELNAEKKKAAALFNSRRTSLVGQQAGKPGAAPKSRKRESPCPPAVAPKPGVKSAGLGENSQPLEAFYPALERRTEVEGTVLVLARISESGCMEHAEVAKSSGVDSLDESALLWAEYANFRPADKDGKPAADTARFAVKFDLQD
jgi:TonB family protein